jgi:hypothetical protein
MQDPMIDATTAKQHRVRVLWPLCASPPATGTIEHLGDAKQFLTDIRRRFARFGLDLHEDKSLIQFGRFAAPHPGTDLSLQAREERLRDGIVVA